MRSGDDQAIGSVADDHIMGENGIDTLEGGLGDDTLTAGSNDLIDLSGTALGDLAALLEVTIQSGADAVIQVAADGSLTLIGVDMSDLHGDVFAFGA